jgi:hypothetical protein
MTGIPLVVLDACVLANFSLCDTGCLTFVSMLNVPFGNLVPPYYRRYH